MNTIILQQYYIFSLAIIMMMLLITWYVSQINYIHPLKLVLYFWVSHGIAISIGLITTTLANGPYVALSTLAWPFIVYFVDGIFRELSPSMRPSPIRPICFLLPSYLATFGFIVYGASFTMAVAPAIYTLGAYGLHVCWRFWRSFRFKRMGVLEKTLLLLFIIYVLHIMDWPILRMNKEFVSLGFFIYAMQLVGFAIVLPTLVIRWSNERIYGLLEKAKFSALEEMAGGIAHEINNPLAIIIGRSEQLQRRFPVSQGYADLVRELENIKTTAMRISTIVVALKEFSDRTVDENHCTMNLKDLFQNVLIYSTERFSHLGIKFIITGNMNVLVKCGPSLPEVLLNLLENALEASLNSKEKWVRLHFEKKKDVVTISVTDSGLGVPEQIQSKIMQPFFTTKEVGQGPGLGLSISRGIVEKHKGRLYYDGSSGHTSFTAELPL